MLDSKIKKEKLYKKYERYESETLENILKEDSLLYDDDDVSEDFIFCITDILSKREENIDIEAKWKSFNENYLSLEGDGLSLYDYGEENDNLSSSNNEIINTRGRMKLNFSWVSAAVLILLLIGTSTAYVFANDLWWDFVSWTKDNFAFESKKGHISLEDSTSSLYNKKVAEELEGLESALEKHGVSNLYIPAYLPQDFKEVESQFDEGSQAKDFYVLLENKDSFISLNYKIRMIEDLDYSYVKSEKDPVRYYKNGIVFYILENNDSYSALWQVEDLEVIISGVNSYETLIKIIDSIN